MSYFDEFEGVTEPSKDHLVSFLRHAWGFLFDTMRNRLVGFERIAALDPLTAQMKGQVEVLIDDRKLDFDRIISAVDRLPRHDIGLAAYGLVGIPQGLKLSALVRLENRVGFFRSEEIIRKILRDIDDILNSTCDALKSAADRSRPDALQYQSALLDVEMETIQQEIKKTLEVLLDRIDQHADRPATRKGKLAMAV